MKKEAGIYKLTHTPTGHFYIGSTVNLYGRISSHISTLRHNNHSNATLQRLWNESPKRSDFHGEIIHSIDATDAELGELERTYIRYYIDDPLCVNQKVIGTRTNTGGHLSDTHRLRLAASNVSQRPSTVTFISPEGKEVTTSSVSRFARENGLSQSAANRVATGHIKHHKKWTLKKTREFMSPYKMVLGTVRAVDFKKNLHLITDDNYAEVAERFGVRPILVRNFARTKLQTSTYGLNKCKGVEYEHVLVDPSGEKWIVPDTHAAHRAFNTMHGLDYKQYMAITRKINIRKGRSVDGWRCLEFRPTNYDDLSE